MSNVLHSYLEPVDINLNGHLRISSLTTIAKHMLNPSAINL
uniref:Uncharacterized protein n=1 Tax=Tetranychus urticae TaxID=32264 RepID=T1KIG3_TETUR